MNFKEVTPSAKLPEERYWSTATRAAPVQMPKPGGEVPPEGQPAWHFMPQAGLT
jgi:hypothetical protein